MNRLLLWCSEKYEAASPSSWLSAAVALGITTALWLVAKGMDIQAEGLLPFRAIGQLTGLWAATLMCLTILSVARTRGLEQIGRAHV